MRQYDSSRTRVAPVFSRLQAIDPTGRSWLGQLLQLPKSNTFGSRGATPWMPVRHQMLRHFDAAWELSRRRTEGFLAFSLFSGESALECWAHAATQTIAPDSLDASLPHRLIEERSRIAEAVIGVTTWQDVCDTLSIPKETLIEKVV